MDGERTAILVPANWHDRHATANQPPPALLPLKGAGTQVNPDTTPVILVHGANYRSTTEAWSDFVLPFAAAAIPHCPSRRKSVQPYVVHWTSERMFPLNLPGMARLALNLSHHVAAAERVAWSCSRLLSHGLADIMRYHARPPVFVSHSMGALVLAHSLGRLLRAGHSIPPGSAWLSLQPFLERDAYSCGSRFSFVPRLFTRKGGRHAVWFSRQDFVLRAIANLGPRREAMGLTGVASPGVDSTDTTHEAQEAHGTLTLRSSKGNFFERMEKRLAAEFSRMVWDPLGPSPV